MLRKLYRSLEKKGINKEKFHKFVNQNIKQYGLIPFQNDFLVNPWTEKKIFSDFKNENETNQK